METIIGITMTVGVPSPGSGIAAGASALAGSLLRMQRTSLNAPVAQAHGTAGTANQWPSSTPNRLPG